MSNLTSMIGLEHGYKGKNSIEQEARVCHQQLLLLHLQSSDKELARADSAPADSHARHHVANQSGEGEEDADAREANKGKKAVAENRDNADKRDARKGHQVEEGVHGQAAQQADTIDVVEVQLSRKHDKRTKGKGKDDGTS